MRKLFKILSINALLIVVALISLDLIFGHWVSYLSASVFKDQPEKHLTERYYETVFVHCPDSYLHHVYCPSISHRRQMSEADGGHLVISYVNKSSIRVSAPQEMNTTTDTAVFDIVNIGDSFLQADEIPYENTLSRILETETGRRTLQVGFASWAPVNFRAWLKRNPLKDGVTVNVFLMTNDVLPGYSFSNVAYHNKGQRGPDGEVTFESFGLPIPVALKHMLAMNSAVYRLLRTARNSLAGSDGGALIEEASKTMVDDLTMPQSDCRRLDQYDGVSASTMDYVRIAFVADCWDAELKKNVDSAVEDLRASIASVQSVGGKMRIFVIPPAWAFEDEGEDAKAHPRFNIATTAAITSEPLVMYLKSALDDTDVEVISLEKVLRSIKAAMTERLYFPADAHWNETAHRAIGHWMAKHTP